MMLLINEISLGMAGYCLMHYNIEALPYLSFGCINFLMHSQNSDILHGHV